MATPRVKSRAGSTVARLAPTIASEFDRVSCPSRCEIRGSTPSSRIRCSNCWVPQVPAASTTCFARIVRRPAGPIRSLPVRTASTSQVPSACGRTAVTVVIECTVAPARSAK